MATNPVIHFQTDDFVEKTMCILSQALKFHPENADEIFQVFVHVSPQLGHLLPLDIDLSPSQNFVHRNQNGNSHKKNVELKHLQLLSDTLILHYVSKLEVEFPYGNNAKCDEAVKMSTYPKELSEMSSYLEKLQVLAGERHAEEKFALILSRHMEFLLQNNITYVHNAVCNFTVTKDEFLCLGDKVKSLVNKVIQILFSASMFKEKSKLIEFIQETILEKLAVELLTWCDCIKDGTPKFYSQIKPETSVGVNNKQKPKISSPASSDDAHLSVETISCFSDIVNIFLSLEQQMQTSETLNIIDYGHKFKSKKGVLKNNSFDLPDLIKTSQHSHMVQSFNSFSHWNWCEALRELSPLLTSSMVFCFRQMMQRLLQDTKEKCDSNVDLETDVSASSKLNWSAIEQPKRVLKCIGNLLKVIVKWLPLGVLGGQYRYMYKLQTDFLDMINQAFKDVKPFLVTLLDDVPEKISPTILPVLLSSSVDIVNVLQYCGRKMQHDNRMPFSGTIQLYTSLSDRIHQHIIQYHKTKLVTVLLHDAESNYWSDPRAFYEDERCSYSVDMWIRHILSLFDEMSYVLSTEASKKIIGVIFCESLTVLANRYCNCHPSHNRHNQTRRDIFIILQFCFNILWKVSSNPFNFCPRKDTFYQCDSDDYMTKIHSACSDLFTCIIVQTSPLQDLHSVVSIIERSEIPNTLAHEWLHLLNASLFPVGWDGKLCNLRNEALILCIIKHVIHNPEKSVKFTLNALVARNCYLSNILLSGKLLLKNVDVRTVQCLLLNSFLQYSDKFAHLLVECAKSTSVTTHSVFTCLDFLQKQYEDSRLPWQIILHYLIMPKVAEALYSTICFIASHTWSSFGKDVCNDLPSTIKNLIPGIADDEPCELMHLCTTMVIHGLHVCALTLTDSLVSVFIEIDHFLHYERTDVNLLCGTYGSHILLYSAYAHIMDCCSLSTLNGIVITGSMKAELQKVGEALLDINFLEANLSGESSNHSILLLNEIQAYKRFTYDIFHHTNKSDSELGDLDFYSLDCSLETECFSENMVQSVTELSRLLQENFDNIAHQLDIRLTGITSKASVLGDCLSNHKCDFPVPFQNNLPSSWNWKSSTMYCLLSQPVDVITHLLYQRPEMQEHAFLTDEEKDMVNFIKRYFKTQPQ